MHASRVPLVPLLRFAVLADAAASGVTGLLMAALAGILAVWFALPEPHLFWVGLFCIAYALFLVALANAARVPGRLVGALVVGNGLWAIACVAIAFGPWFSPSTAGIVFLLIQAAAVVALAELQYFGLRRARVAAAPEPANEARMAHAR